MEAGVARDEAVSLYLDLKPGERVDLEVAATAAIEWSRAIKAAAVTVEPGFEYRVRLIAAKPGSSKWLAAIERSPINQAAKDVKAGFEAAPLILRLAVGAAVFAVTTVYPTYELYFGEDEGFTPKQREELEEAFKTAIQDPAVKAHRQAMYWEVQQDRNIIALGGGVPDSEDWRPPAMVPADRFAEGDGLFEVRLPEEKEGQRTIYQTLDVILVTPRLVNAELSWTFRQEGIPGQFNAKMRDAKFLVALERNDIQENLRANIPMRIKLEIKEVRTDGEWKVRRGGRSVVEVVDEPTATENLGGLAATSLATGCSSSVSWGHLEEGVVLRFFASGSDRATAQTADCCRNTEALCHCVTCARLAPVFGAVGFEDNVRNLRNKVSRRTFSAGFCHNALPQLATHGCNRNGGTIRWVGSRRSRASANARGTLRRGRRA